MYFQTGRVIFVPEWPNGEFVSILALFCVWTKSLMCKRCCKHEFHFQSDVKIRRNSSSLSAVRTLICLLLHPSGRCVIQSGRQKDQHHSSGRRAYFVRTFHCIEKFLFQLAPSGRFSSKSGRPSALDQSLILSKFQGREDQSTVRTMWYPFWTRVSIRQESQFKFDRPNA